MTSRTNPLAHFDLLKPLIEFSKSSEAGLDPTLVELIKIRASQINGCARCLVMHTQDARKLGESEERLYLLSAWREASLFDERERAVLAWTEALTYVHAAGAPDQAYEALKAHFTPEEQLQITLLIGAINAWNRLNVGFHVSHTTLGGRRAA
jgi:AhpD family alkylhydroperoxidase